jgi:hypothetical protein
MATNPPITYRTFTGFGEATHEAVLASMGSLRRFCINPNDYLFRLLRPSKLLKLPDELLLQVSHSIDGVGRNQDLRHLALACRRLRPIAQEALVCNAVVTPNSIRGFLKTLSHHTEHVAKMGGKLQLHAVDYHTWPDDRATFWSEWNFAEFLTSQLYKVCFARIGEICGPVEQNEWARNLLANDEISRPACLAALLLAVPKLQELSVTDTFLQRCGLFYDSRHSLRNPSDGSAAGAH